MNSSEYKKIIEELYQNQYSCEAEDELNNDKNIWLPDTIGSDKLEKLRATQNSQQLINATTYSIEEIKQKIQHFHNIKISNFIIKIINTYGNTADIVIYEDQIKTKPTNIIVKVNLKKDSRFNNRSWSSYFDQFNVGKRIPIEEFYNICRWLQAIDRMSAFL